MSRSKSKRRATRAAASSAKITGAEANDTGEQSEDAAEAAPEPSRLAVIWEQVWTLLLAISIAMAIRTFVVEPFRIPSGSMLPTLLIGDHLFVNKFIYGVKLPFTDYRLPGLRKPERGDVVVFEVARGDGRRVPSIVPADRYPDLPRDDFVKRIVGLPGDRVSVINGQVTVNGEPAPQIDTGSVFEDDLGFALAIRRENLVGCAHAVLDDPRSQGLQKSAFVVPEDRYFMVGDNRDNSNDSRQWGTVRFDQFKGPAFILYWSWDVNGSALQFFNPSNWWNADKRWERVFRRIRCEPPTASHSGEASQVVPASSGSLG